MIWQHQARNDERLLTPRLELVPVVADDAEELTDVFGDQRLYAFLASHPSTSEELRAQFARLAGSCPRGRQGGDRAAQLDGAPSQRQPSGGHAAGGLLR